MKRIYLHPLPLRIWHWVNALMVILLIITGIELRLPGIAGLSANSTALLVHRYAGWGMVISCVFWFVYNLISGNLKRHYIIRRQDVKGILRQVKFYLFSIFKGEESPFRRSPEEKFNPLQKLVYGAIMCIFSAVLVVSGVLFSDILFFRKYILRLNIIKMLDAVHVIAAYVFVLYLVVHIYMSTLGPRVFPHIKAMILGYEDEADEPGATTALISSENAVACQECHTEGEGTNIDG
jgi:thiosulfate reductase cytochrome b subunit